jgi:hypothetical protein
MGAGQALWTHLLTGLGLAGAAGLNAYLPLLGVAVLARLHVLTLSPPLDLLGHPRRFTRARPGPQSRPAGRPRSGPGP